MRFVGETEVNGQRYPLEIVSERSDQYRRTVSHGDRRALASWNGEQLTYTHEESMDIPSPILEQILSNFEFDGWMVEWKQKGHRVWRLGMKKMGKKLPWLMEAELSGGQTWHIYVDSLTGDATRKALISQAEQEIIAMEFEAFKDVDGFRMPHIVKYYSGDQLIAVDHIETIELTVLQEPASGLARH